MIFFKDILYALQGIPIVGDRFQWSGKYTKRIGDCETDSSRTEIDSEYADGILQKYDAWI